MNINTEFLKKQRHIGDVLADNTVKFMFENLNKTQTGTVFKEITKDFPNMEVLPQEVQEYFNSSKTLPSWANKELLNLGADVFKCYGPEILFVLMCKSLPECYACGNGAKVLYATKKIVKNEDSLDGIKKRLTETAHFVLSVLAPNGFEENGVSIRTIQKVRLMHACARYCLQKKDWDYSLGLPINQEDMTGTLMSFCVLVLDGLAKIGIELSAKQKNAFFHVWRVAGFILGVKEELIPHTLQEGREIARLIFVHQAKASTEGIALTQSIIELIQKSGPINCPKFIPESLMVYFVGEEVAEYVGLKKLSPFAKAAMPFLFKTMGHMKSVITKKKMVYGALTTFNLKMIHFLLDHFYSIKSPMFELG